jgi:alcohol dehydrogenase class IV
VNEIAGEFNNERNWKVLFGRNSLKKLPSELDRFNSNKVLVVTTNSVSKSSALEKVKDVLGSKLTCVYAGSKQNSPLSSVYDGLEKMKENHVDAVISLGGGSNVDVAKGMIMAHTYGDLDILIGKVKREKANVSYRYEKIKHVRESVPLFAIPTTLSGAEFTYQAGLTDTNTGRKDQYYAEDVLAKSIILDPEITLDTPTTLWLSSGVKAIDHGVERLYSNTHHPFSDVIQLGALSLLFANLKQSHDKPSDLNSRNNLLYASWMVQFCTKNVHVGVGHAIDHQICGYYNISHGIAASVMLPNVMQFNSDVAGHELSEMAKAIGAGNTAEDAIEATRSLIKVLGLPTRLRDIGVKEDDFGMLAERTLIDTAIAGNPKAVNSKDEIIGILRSAW